MGLSTEMQSMEGLAFIQFWQIAKDKRSHSVQTRFNFFPIWHDLFQPIEALTVVVLGNMTKLMKNHVVNAVAWRLDKVGIQRNPTIR